MWHHRRIMWWALQIGGGLIVLYSGHSRPIGERKVLLRRLGVQLKPGELSWLWRLCKLLGRLLSHLWMIKEINQHEAWSIKEIHAYLMQNIEVLRPWSIKNWSRGRPENEASLDGEATECKLYKSTLVVCRILITHQRKLTHKQTRNKRLTVCGTVLARNDIPYSRKVWRGFKFVALGVWVESGRLIANTVVLDDIEILHIDYRGLHSNNYNISVYGDMTLPRWQTAFFLQSRVEIKHYVVYFDHVTTFKVL